MRTSDLVNMKEDMELAIAIANGTYQPRFEMATSLCSMFREAQESITISDAVIIAKIVKDSDRNSGVISINEFGDAMAENTMVKWWMQKDPLIGAIVDEIAYSVKEAIQKVAGAVGSDATEAIVALVRMGPASDSVEAVRREMGNIMRSKVSRITHRTRLEFGPWHSKACDVIDAGANSDMMSNPNYIGVLQSIATPLMYTKIAGTSCVDLESKALTEIFDAMIKSSKELCDEQA